MIGPPEIISLSDDQVTICYPAVLEKLEIEPAIGEGVPCKVVYPPQVIEPARLLHFEGLSPDTEYNFEGLNVRTLKQPPGELLACLACVTDLHFGDAVCRSLGSAPTSPLFTRRPGDLAHPQLMNGGAISSIIHAEIINDRNFDYIIAKGDLTSSGSDQEFALFASNYLEKFGQRMLYIRGNHDAKSDSSIPKISKVSHVTNGVELALLDTNITDMTSGYIDDGQLEWISSLESSQNKLIFLFGHHHPFSPDSAKKDPNYFGIEPDTSKSLVNLIEQNRKIVGYFAGHTHRNRIRYFSQTDCVPYVETACIKDFPGSWTEYRIFEGGTLQIHRRIEDPDCLAWSEANRSLYGGLYPDYAMGKITDRSLFINYRK